MARLMEHDFPGNVRELENIIEQAFVLCRGGLIEMGHLPPELRRSSILGSEGEGSMTLAAMEKKLIVLSLSTQRQSQEGRQGNSGLIRVRSSVRSDPTPLETPTTDGRRR